MKLNKKIIIPICLLLISIITFYRLCRPGYFSMMDEMHVFRLQQFDKCLNDGQIPCRYIQDGGLGYGYPLYNYYSPLSYSIAEFFHLVGFSLINSLKITFIICHLLGGFGMYHFAFLYWGKLGGFISAVIFLLAPYQATDSYVRGAIAELLALNIIPWVFYFLTKYIKSSKNKYLLILSLTALLLSHNLAILAIAPILVVYSLYLLFQNKDLNIKSLFKLFIPVIFSIGLSAFFLIPAIYEKNLVTVETMTQGYFQYINHFATLKQLFISRFWGFGASLWGPVDDMAFSVGHIQWLIPLIVISFLSFKIILNKIPFPLNKNKTSLPKNTFLTIIFFIFFLFSLFLTHNKSTFIWKTLPFMAYFQFPWRFLLISTFTASFISGFIIILFKKKFQYILVVLITAITIILNFSYFKEDIWYPNMDDQQKLTKEEIIKQSGAGLKDYWPKYGKNFPTIYAPEAPHVIQGEVDFSKFYKNSKFAQGYFTVSSDTATINLPIVYFPNWIVFLDNNQINFDLDSNLGLIQLDVDKGEHHLQAHFKNTPIRTLSNTISLISLTCLLIFLFHEKRS